MKYKIGFVMMLLVACANSQKNQEVLAPVEFKKKLLETKNAFLLDVRTPEEVASGKLEGANNVMFDDTFESRLSLIPNRPVFVYCAAGKRSAKAAQILRNKGYTAVYELQGGINAWREASLPVK
jgi:rhodanese-related sulfurtransferase